MPDPANLPDGAGPPRPPLRILTFLRSFEPGGVEKVALRLAEAWQGLGIVMHIVVGRDEGAARAEAPPFDYHILPKRFPPTRLQTMWRIIMQLPRIIVRERPDVIFVAGNTYAGIAVLLKMVLGAACPPLVMKVSNDLDRRDLGWMLRPLYRAWLKVQGRYIDHFVGMAEATRGEIMAGVGASPDRVSIISDPAISIDEIDRLSRPRCPAKADKVGRQFVAVGRLVPQKNFPHLVRAFADIARKHDQLVIVGEGPERRHIERIIAALGLEQAVHLPGHANPADWLTRADIFVLSSDYEGLPAVVVEALAAGLQIVATDCSVAMAELLDAGRLGTLVKVGDRAALGEAMSTIPISHRMRTDGRLQAAGFTIENAAPHYLDLFRKVLSPRPSRQSLPIASSGRSPRRSPA